MIKSSNQKEIAANVLPIQAYAPPIGEQETQALAAALNEGYLVGAGPIGRRVEKQMQEIFGVKHVLLTASCTAALEMAMMVLDVGPGDEVIMPSFTFVSTANCVVLRGARPIFADIDPQTLCLDPTDVARKITPRTKAILLMHYAGGSCDMTTFRRLAHETKLPLIEDAAQVIDATYCGEYLGTLGTVGCYSFHATKNIVCGEGGAFVTNDSVLARQAEIIREKGTNRSAFLRGEVDKYTWVAPGSSYILSDLLAALLETQLEKRTIIKAQRRAVWDLYFQELMPLAEEGKIQLPTIPPEVESNFHIFFLLTQTAKEQQELLIHLKTAGIPATFHYVPLHSSPFGQTVTTPTELPVTNSVAERLVRLPIGTQISEDQACYVVEQVLDFYDTV